MDNNMPVGILSRSTIVLVDIRDNVALTGRPKALEKAKNIGSRVGVIGIAKVR